MFLFKEMHIIIKQQTKVKIIPSESITTVIIQITLLKYALNMNETWLKHGNSVIPTLISAPAKNEAKSYIIDK